MEKKLLMVFISFVLSGCIHAGTANQSNKRKTDVPVATLTRNLAQCQTELVSLRAFDSIIYNQQKIALDSSIRKASQYSLMRTKLSTDMQQVMDSVYQAQLARQCQEIHAQLFQLMLKHADETRQ